MAASGRMQLIATVDDRVVIQQNLAHALLFQGHYDEARASYNQAIALAPDISSPLAD